MPKVALYDMSANKVNDIDLNETIFGVEVNVPVMHQAVKLYLANQRLGTSATKTRAMKRGGGKKPWRQKGTGRARSGSTRSPLWVGGGVALGPQPRSYAIKMPRKVRRLAIKSALSSKIGNESLWVLDKLQLTEIKTKNIIKMLSDFKVTGKKALIVTADYDEMVVRSSRNIPGVKAVPYKNINTYDLLHHDHLFLAQDAIAKIEEVFA